MQASASCRTFLLYSAVKRRLLALDVTSVGERGGTGRWFDDVVTSSLRLLALYTKLRAGDCLTHVGREGRLRHFPRAMADAHSMDANGHLTRGARTDASTKREVERAIDRPPSYFALPLLLMPTRPRAAQAPH